MTYAQLKGHLRTSIGRFVSKTFDGILKGLLNERYFTILSGAPGGFMQRSPYVYFFYIFLKRNQILITDKQEGSVQPHIYPSHLMDLDVFNYSEKLIQKFENYCIDIFNKIKANQSQINTLENLRDTLLPKLMSGEVRIKHEQVIQ